MGKNVRNQKSTSFGIGSLFIVIVVCFIALAAWGIFSKTTDKSADELKPDSPAHPHVFSYAPDGETIWLGTHMGVYERKDGKWKRTLPSLSSNDVMGVEVDPSNANQIVVSGHGFVKRTNDGGKTWEAAEKGLPNQPKPDVPDAHQLTADSKDAKHLFTMLAGRGDNLFESKDGGASWTKAGSVPPGSLSIAVIPDNASSILAGTEKGLFRYDISNGSVKETKLGNEPVFQLLALPNGQIITMNEGSFTRSSDLKTWEPIKVELKGEMPLGIKASKKNPNRMVIVTQQLNVYESKDGGNTWAKL